MEVKGQSIMFRKNHIQPQAQLDILSTDMNTASKPSGRQPLVFAAGEVPVTHAASESEVVNITANFVRESHRSGVVFND